MSEVSDISEQTGPEPSNEQIVDSVAASNRRDFLTTATTLAMVGGLAAGYGTFFSFAGHFLYPTGKKLAWLFVSTLDAIGPGDSLSFESPSGVKVVIKRRAESTAASADDFIALSSTCPHLGCRVHWEPQNNRFFCPCHNGEFDPSGNPTGGPVLAANQSLPRYPLRVEGGMLFIEMSVGDVGSQEGLIERPVGSSMADLDAAGDSPWA
jgi:Rieske Fe-S protein